MDGFNRYQDISTSVYTPRQLSETLMVPMAKRAMHEQAQKDLYSQVGELDKIDPLDVHFTEAQQIKANLLKKIDEQSANLATKGFNFDTNADIFKTNRYIKDEFSPTGRAGQINLAKKDYLEKRAAFLEDAVKNQKHSMSDALRNWNEMASKYTGYEDPEKSKIAQISQLGAPKNIDLTEHIDKLAKNAGFTDISQATKSGGLVDTGIPGENRFTVNIESAHRVGQNVEQLKSLAKLLNHQLSDPTSELRRSEEFKGRDVHNSMNEALQQLGIYNKLNVVDSRGRTISNVDWSKPEDKLTDYEKVPYGVETTQGSDDVASRVGKIGTVSVAKAAKTSGALSKLADISRGTQDVGDKEELLHQAKEVLSPNEYSQYKSIKSQLSKTPGWHAMDESQRNQAIGEKMKQLSVTFSPTVIKPTGKALGTLIPHSSNLKDINSAGANILSDVRQNVRKLYDAETGKEIPASDLTGSKVSMQLYGVMSPHNLQSTKMEGATASQKVSPIIVSYTDKDGETHTAYASRHGNELKDPSFQKLQYAHNIFNEVVNNVGSTRMIKTGPLKGNAIQYDPNASPEAPIKVTNHAGKSTYISIDEWQKESMQ